MKITREDDEIVIRVPFFSQRSNPWDENFSEQMENVLGVIDGDECCLAHWIDMDYKDKADQISSPFLTTYMDKDEFRKLCKELDIDCVEYENCHICRKSILGVHTLDNVGFVHIECKEK